MASIVQPARFLDAAVMALFAMVLSALMLYMFGEFWNLSQDARFSQWKIGFFMQKLFPFKRNFDFNLTHILLFTVCVLLLSFRPDYESLPAEQQAQFRQSQACASSSCSHRQVAESSDKEGKKKH
ncbi:hypothetical protein BESB_002450 [Besnoitia besnoiti]|uniref:Transmembrane protein n=1 Tax=Besnoitia besnoiti TaxID=94643 RepID=A0A2A9MKY5_BESBE|nr:hypothetical protein BESB_002450 [Besnoitia besnoiti]PFH37904.1 hypothetical protein BESB_002450 [Besnoitia besnoiti]